MNRRTEVIRNILALLEIMEEGLVYIKQKLGELNIEGTVTILTDTINAFSTVERSISQMLKELPENKIIEKTDKLRTAFDIIVKEYENKGGQKAFEITQLTLNPAFKNWKEEIEKTLRPYTTA